MISKLFRTRYKIELRDDGYLWTGFRKWYAHKWTKVGWAKNMESAMRMIAEHRNPPQPPQPDKPVTVHYE